ACTAYCCSLSLHDALPILFSIVAVVLGVAAVAFGLLSGDHATVERTYANLLLMGYYFTCVCAAGAFFVALQYVTQSAWSAGLVRSEEHTSELQSRENLVCC